MFQLPEHFFCKKRKKVSRPEETDFSRTNQSSEKTEDPPETTFAQFPTEMEKALESSPTPKAEAQTIENTRLPEQANAGSAQDDIDVLFGGVVREAKPTTPAPTPEAAADGTISQADLDSLLLGAVPEEAKERPTKGVAPELSQDNLNSLLAGGAEGDESSTGAVGGRPAPAGGEPTSAVSEATIRSLLTEEEDGMASLFEEAANASSEEQTLVAAATSAAPAATPAEPRQTAGPHVQMEAEQEQPAFEGAKPEESAAEAASSKRPRKLRISKITRKQKLAAVSIAASAALAFFGGYRYRIAGGRSPAVSEKKRFAAALPKQGAGVAAVQPAAQPEKKVGPEPPQKPEPAVPAAKTEPPPPITAQPRDVGNNISFGITVPVDFNARMVKVMTADVEVTFASDNDKKSAERRRFLYELEIEKEIGAFFKDKFYEDTHYAQDKLAAYLIERVKKRHDLGRVVEISLENFDVR